VTGAVGIYAHDDSGESIADDALRVTEQRRRASGFVDAFNRSHIPFYCSVRPVSWTVGNCVSVMKNLRQILIFLQALAFGSSTKLTSSQQNSKRTTASARCLFFAEGIFLLYCASMSIADDIRESINALFALRKRRFITQILSFGMIICTALMIWKSLMVITGSESPIVVVLSESMETAFFRGDLLFLWNDKAPLKVGDITVFSIDGQNIPVVHRVITVHDCENGTMMYLTKGDNNNFDDRVGGIYPRGQEWLLPKNIIGKPRAYLPLVGMVTILMNDYPKLKYLLIGLLGLFALFGRD